MDEMNERPELPEVGELPQDRASLLALAGMVRSALELLSQRVDRGDFGSTPYWRGADVVVVPELLPEDPDAFYPPDLQVRTDHVGEVSWIIFELRDIFLPFLDFQNKFEFYGTIAEALILAIDAEPGRAEDLKNVLSSAVAAAFDLLARLEENLEQL